MSRITMNRLAMVLLVLLVISPSGLWAKKAAAEPEADPEAIEEAVPEERVEPRFPEENPTLVFVEGEDAVSTNFNKEPILNYSCSGSRTLQLNRMTGLQGGAPFYADYIFYLEQEGRYELWYGGTPPGPRDDLLPSYASPFRYVLDAGEAEPVYREETQLASSYTPSYYWNRVGELELAQGRHTLKFEVAEQRRYDSKFYFYLDCFFLVKIEEERRVPGTPLPAVFPADLEDRSRDFPFKSLEDYEIIIRDEPENVAAYIELSLIHTLLGDYLSALKYLKRAQIINPTNTELTLLRAKNRIWKGDVTEGLKLYRELLLSDPRRLDTWVEAGKVAAWTGRYEESTAFFKDGLTYFEGDPQLLVNLGLNMLWAGREVQAETYFQEARRRAGEDAARLEELARIYDIAGYPERAAAVQREIIRLFPEQLSAYLALQAAYIRSGDTERAQRLERRIEASFIPSERLARVLKIFQEKQGLKLQVMAAYEERLRQEPDNLQLRELLAQTYFWNGLNRRAIDEYLDILVNHAFRSLQEMDAAAARLYALLDNGYVFLDYFSRLEETVAEKQKETAAQLSAYKSAESSYLSFLAKAEKAKAKGEPPPQPEGEDPYVRLKAEGDKLAALVTATEILSRDLAEHRGVYDQGAGRLAELRSAEQAEEEMFTGLIQVNRWQWDKKAYLDELRSANQRGLTLARYVLGKIQLFDRELPAARRNLEAAADEGQAAPVYAYALLQNRLWEGEAEAAFDLVEAAGPGLVAYQPHLQELAALYAELAEEHAPEEVFFKESPEEDTARAQALLSGLEKELPDLIAPLAAELEQLHGLLDRRLVRTFYYLGENTFLLRNELADFLLKEEDLEAAIFQLRQVLAIDPWDVRAIFRLGKIYEWNGNWQQAMENYRRVYYADPQYENVTSIYNQLARQHADTLAFSAYTLAESEKLTVHAEGSFINLISGVWGLGLRYSGEHVRITNPALERASYQVHDLELSVPLEFSSVKLKLTPAGGAAFTHSFYEDGAIPASVDAGDLLSGYEAVPHLGLSAEIPLSSALLLAAGYGYGRQPETLAPGIGAVWEHSGELDLAVSFSFLENLALKNSYLRTYGQLKVRDDGNLMYAGTQEASVGVLKLKNPEFLVSLTGNVLYQDTNGKGGSDYFIPDQELVAGGGLTVSSWSALGEEGGLGLYGRANVSSFTSHTFSSDIIKYIQMEFEAGVELSRGEASYSFSAGFTNTREYEPVKQWDYWSFVARLGFASRMPRLLAP
jgi:tetratricopeptide (TPR) repeat protein